jgi:hypothetical protein
MSESLGSGALAPELKQVADDASQRIERVLQVLRGM